MYERLYDGVVAVLGGGLGKKAVDGRKVGVVDLAAPPIHALGHGFSVLLGEGLGVSVSLEP
jgi:hypothetical protein